MPEIKELLNRFDNEIELLKVYKQSEDVKRANKHSSKVEEQVINDLHNFVKEYITKYGTYEHIHMFSYHLKEYLRGGLLSPLRLTDDEFKFITYGLSENVRYPSIKRDLTCIYDDKAYETFVKEVYDSFTGRELEITEFHGTELSLDYNRCYLIKGGKFTPYYFNKAKIKQKYIKDKHYFPIYGTIDISCMAIVNDDKFILCCKDSDFGYARLCKFYQIDLIKDENEELIKFGIDYEFD